MKYADRQPVLVGDEVDLDGEHAVVEAVIESPEAMADYGYDEPSVVFRCDRMGLVSQACDPEWTDIFLIRRQGPPAAS